MSLLRVIHECCSVLQCVAVCHNLLQCVTVRCNVLQYVAVFCSVLEERHHQQFVPCSFLLCNCCYECVPSQHLHLKVRRVLFVSVSHGHMCANTNS